MGSADGLTGDTSKAPAYACRNRSTRESGPGDGWRTRALELGGGTTVSGQMLTGEATGRFPSGASWSAAAAAGSADLTAGAGIATVTRAGEATGGVCLSSSTSVIGTPECATPDWSMRMGSAVGMSAELGGGVFGGSLLLLSALGLQRGGIRGPLSGGSSSGGVGSSGRHSRRSGWDRSRSNGIKRSGSSTTRRANKHKRSGKKKNKSRSQKLPGSSGEVGSEAGHGEGRLINLQRYSFEYRSRGPSWS